MISKRESLQDWRLRFPFDWILRIPRVKRWPVSSCRAALWRISSLDTCGRKIRARCRWIWVSPRRDRVTSQGKICKAPFFAHFFIEFYRFDIIIKCQNKINEIFTAPCYLDDSFSPKMTIWNEYGRNSNRYNMYIYIYGLEMVFYILCRGTSNCPRTAQAASKRWHFTRNEPEQMPWRMSVTWWRQPRSVESCWIWTSTKELWGFVSCQFM